jgi:antitoxin MazE
MLAKVQKWGNSLAVRLPKALADEIEVAADSSVELLVRDHEIVLRPVAARKSYRLDDLLTGVTAENLHDESDFGAPQGQEVW